MKRITLLLLTAVVVMMVFTGCSNKTAKNTNNQKPITAQSNNPNIKPGEKKAVDETATQPDKMPFPEKPTAKDVLERMAVVYKSIKTMKSKETIYVTYLETDEEFNIKHTFIRQYVRPNKMKLDVDLDGDNITNVSDGKTSYSYSKRDNTYRKRPAPKLLIDPQHYNYNGIESTALLVGIDISSYIKSAILKPSQKIGGVETYVIQYPIGERIRGVKAKGTETIFVGKNDFLIRQISNETKITLPTMQGGPGGKMPGGPITKKSQGTMKITQKTVVKSIVVDKPISDATFKFVPPPGARDAAKVQMPKPPAPPDVIGKAAPGLV